jgi:hypothetical protein
MPFEHGGWRCHFFAIAPSLRCCSVEDTRGRAGEDGSGAASGTDRAWQVGMTVCGGGCRGFVRGDGSPLASMDWPSTILNHMWILGGGGLLVDGAGPFAAMDNAEEGVRSSSLDGDGADDGSARRPWRVERQRPRIATIVVMGFVLAGPEPVEGNESVRDSREGQRPMVAMAAFILADASAVEDDIVCAQPRGLLLCFGQRDHRAAHHLTNADEREHVFPYFMDRLDWLSVRSAKCWRTK